MLDFKNVSRADYAKITATGTGATITAGNSEVALGDGKWISIAKSSGNIKLNVTAGEGKTISEITVGGSSVSDKSAKLSSSTYAGTVSTITEDTVINVTTTNAVASVGEIRYATLKDALAVAHSGETKIVILTADASVTEETTIESDVTLQIPNDKVLTVSSTLTVNGTAASGGKIENNGKIEGSGTVDNQGEIRSGAEAIFAKTLKHTGNGFILGTAKFTGVASNATNEAVDTWVKAKIVSDSASGWGKVSDTDEYYITLICLPKNIETRYNFTGSAGSVYQAANYGANNDEGVRYRAIIWSCDANSAINWSTTTEGALTNALANEKAGNVNSETLTTCTSFTIEMYQTEAGVALSSWDSGTKVDTVTITLSNVQNVSGS